MVIKSKYSTINAGDETLFTVTVPDDEYGEMLRENPDTVSLRADILNEAGRVEQKRIELKEYENQNLTDEQMHEVRLLAAAIAKQNQLIAECTDDRCGYRDIQMRLTGGHRLSAGMEREIERVRQTLEPITEDDINNCIDSAMNAMGYISERDYEYFQMRNGHKTWKIERMPVSGMDRETVLKKLGKK